MACAVGPSEGPDPVRTRIGFAALLIGGFILTRARLGRMMGILMLLIYAVYIYGLVNGFNLLGLFQTAPA